MNVSDMLEQLEPLQRNAVLAVYFHGRTPTEAACVLAVERAVLLAALAVAFRRIARWVLDEDASETTVFGPAPVQLPISDVSALARNADTTPSGT